MKLNKLWFLTSEGELIERTLDLIQEWGLFINPGRVKAIYGEASAAEFDEKFDAGESIIKYLDTDNDAREALAITRDIIRDLLTLQVKADGTFEDAVKAERVLERARAAISDVSPG